MLGPEILMGFQAIPGYPEYDRIQLFKLLHPVAEVLAFGGTAGSVVFWIEVNHNILTLQVIQPDGLVSGGCGFKIRNGFV